MNTNERRKRSRDKSLPETQKANNKKKINKKVRKVGNENLPVTQKTGDKRTINTKNKEIRVEIKVN